MVLDEFIAAMPDGRHLHLQNMKRAALDVVAQGEIESKV
jgi:hypothetical protein